MENEEKNINENKELSLQEQLKAQDEFAFLDEEDEIQDTTEQKTLEETKEDNFDSLDLFEASKEIEDEIQEEIIKEKPEETIEKANELEETTLENEEIFKDFPDEQTGDNLVEKPEIEIEAKSFIEEPVFEENNSTSNGNELITVRPIKFQEFADMPPNRTIKKNLDLIQDISMHVSVELGRTKSSIREVMGLEKGSIVELDKIAGEQVEIFVNQKLVAKGEVIVIEDKFGVRVTSTTNPKPQ